MRKIMLSLFLFYTGLLTTRAQQRSLDDYIVHALKFSPLIINNKNQQQLNDEERLRLKAFYTHSRLELNADLLFVPIISRDNGKTTFLADAQSAERYTGYDLGQSSSHLLTGVDFVQPLTGASLYKDESRRLQIDKDISEQQIRLTGHDLGRQVTEQFLLCQLDMENQRSCQEIDSILARQIAMVRTLATHGLTSPADIRLIEIERQSNQQVQQAALQSYLTHRGELNTLCGTADTTAIAPVHLEPSLPPAHTSAFLETYRLDSLKNEADYMHQRGLYRPQLSFYANAGSQTGPYKDFYKRWGVSAGLHLHWTLADGKQLKHQQREMQISQERTTLLRERDETERKLRLAQLEELRKSQDKQIDNSVQLIAQYRQLLSDYQKEIMAGRRSVVDYVNAFKTFTAESHNLNTLKINKELLINTYNYWNW
ncbi:MAG: TolC family protein [Prevotella sp.]|nr:TolC family protein [Prevotella sp.]